MRYANGTAVEVGDRVSLGDDPDGEVVLLVDTGKQSPRCPHIKWRGHLKRGVMIHFPLYGLIHYQSPVVADVQLLGRAAGLSST